jgi:ketosteroid isomerase-like protein
MSKQSVEIVRRILASVNQANWDEAVAAFAPDAAVTVEPDVSPNPDSYRGSDRIRWFWESVARAWSNVKVELQSIEFIEGQVIADILLTMTGRSTRVEVRSFQTHLFCIRDGRVVSLRMFGERDHALDAVKSPK